MKIKNIISLVVALTLLAGCTGTSPKSQRVNQFAKNFDSYSSGDQDLILEGIINKGFDPLMVYMSLGEPVIFYPAGDGEGGKETWIYYGSYPSGKSGSKGNPLKNFKTRNDLIFSNFEKYKRLIINFEKEQVADFRVTPFEWELGWLKQAVEKESGVTSTGKPVISKHPLRRPSKSGE